MSTRMVWELPADAANVAMCRHSVRLLLDHQGIAESDVDEVELIVGELCGNVIRHAYDARGGRFSFEVDLHGDDLRISVRDNGRGFDATRASTNRAFTESGGMGFFLLEEFSDRLQIGADATNGSAVTASRHLLRRAEPRLGAQLGSVAQEE